MALYGTGTSPKTEALINGTWTDISSRVRGEQKITITRGRQNAQQVTSAQTAQFSINNRDGLFTNRNPNSIYFGLLPRNTQVRISAGSGDVYGRLNWQSSTGSINSFFSSDKAAYDIVGNIDMRLEVQPHQWRPETYLILVSKYKQAGNQRSWVLYLGPDGTLRFRWSPDGTSTTFTDIGSTVVIPNTSTRLAVRVTLTVNNGASGNDVRFYTAPSINGSYTQLGATVTTAGVTSIFAGSGDVAVGSGTDTVNVFSNGTAFGGKVFAFQLLNSIGGTKVADADFTAQTIGSFGFTDAAGSAWSLSGSARFTSDRFRFWGEASSLPQVWDKTGKDVYLPVQASGIIRRLTQGASPLNSPMYRNFNQYNPIGYWALEDGSTATAAGSAVGGGSAARAVNVGFGGDNAGLPGAATVAKFNDATSAISGTCIPAATTGTASFVFYVKLASLPASTATLATFTCNGTVRKITVGFSSTNITAILYDAGGTVLATVPTSLTGINPTSEWLGWNLLIQTNGSNVQYSIRFDPLGLTAAGLGPVSLGAGASGAPTGFALSAAADSAYQTAQVAQVFLAQTNFDLTSSVFRNASAAWLGETAGARLVRLCSEESEPFQITGLNADTEPMGYQTLDTFMNLVYDCWTTDGGIGGEARDMLALTYRTRVDMEQRADVTLSYASSHLSDVPLPVDDDQSFTNDVTVSRVGGSSARAIITDGNTSVSDPPVGVGRYATSVNRNVATDGRLPSVAGWAALTGSWDEARYPSVQIGQHRSEIVNNPTLLLQVAALELGDTATLTGLPSFLPPDDVLELVQGYTETLGKFTWDLTFNCTPAGPYRAVGVLGDDYDTPRADGTTHSLGGAGLTTTGVSASLVTAAGSALWVTTAVNPGEFPFDVKLAGEVMTVTAITGTTSPQTATVTRSVNGIVKAHSAGELVRLAHPSFIGS